MAQKYLNYDLITGNVTDASGILIICYPSALPVEVESKGTSIDDMIKLKNSGFTSEEVISIKKANL